MHGSSNSSTSNIEVAVYSSVEVAGSGMADYIMTVGVEQIMC